MYKDLAPRHCAGATLSVTAISASLRANGRVIQVRAMTTFPEATHRQGGGSVVAMRVCSGAREGSEGLIFRVIGDCVCEGGVWI